VSLIDRGDIQGRIAVPMEAQLDLEVAATVCGRLLGAPVRHDEGAWRLVRRLASDIHFWRTLDGRAVREPAAPGEKPAPEGRSGVVFMVGDWASRERISTTQERLEARDLSGLKLEPTGTPKAVNTTALALALAWQDARLRGQLDPGLWRRALADFRTEPAPVVEEPPRGWISAVLFADDADELSPLGGRLRLDLVATNKRSGAPLKPRPAPRSLEAIEKKVTLSAGDRRICRLAEQRRLVGHIYRFKYSMSSNVEDELQHLDQEILQSLSGVTEVWFKELRVQMQSEPWTPRLLVDDQEGGGLALTFAELPLALIQIGGAWVVLGNEQGDGAVMRPVAAQVPRAVRRALFEPNNLPSIPASEVDAFLEDFLSRTALPVEVRARMLGVSRCPVKPRLLLTDRGGEIEVEVRFGYDEAEVTPEAPGDVLRTSDGRLFQRNRGEEAERLIELAQVLPRPAPTTLVGEEGFDFLLDGLPRLVDWAVFLDEKTRKRKPRGTLAVSTQAQTQTDWFDLQVEFALEGKGVKTEQILQAWALGKRYVELSDGRVARLPAEWLRRHADNLGELEEVRQAAGGRLGAFAAPLAAELLGEAGGAMLVQRWRELAERIEAFDRVPERALPAGLQATLRDYQHKGFRWLCALRDLGLGGVLADDMGLGKTVQALAFLLYVHDPIGHSPGPGQAPSGARLASLVVAPTSVVPNWAEEVKRFAPSLRVHLHHGSQRGVPPGDVDLVVTSYALLRIDIELLAARSWRVVLLDEAQAIKNPTSQLAAAARSLQAETRLVLTGTPIENHLIELWSQFQFLMPGFFGGRTAFTRRYATPVQRNDQDALTALRRRMRPFVLRRLKDEVARELPPRQEQVLYCELGPAQRRLYEKVRETWRATVLGSVDSKGIGGSTLQVLEALMRLRQVCCDPHLLPATEAAGVDQAAKLDRLMELVVALAEEGHRALVFSQWPSLLKRVIPRLDAKKIKYLYLDGGTKERGELQTRWNQSDGPPIFLISLKAGGTGMNLVGADHVIHLDPWWNPAVEQQATDRAHRIGQTRPVMVYKLVARGTVEEKILELQARKKALADATIDAERMVVDALTREDLEAVFAPREVDVELELEEEPEAALPAPPSERAEPLPGLPAAVAQRLVADGQLTTTAVMEILGQGRPASLRALTGWIEAGLLVARGEGRGRHYVGPE
jgi:superfamily II DNA or RNA helicase